MDQIPQGVANTAAGSAVGGSFISFAAQALPFVQLVSGVLAAISAALAIAWYVYKFRNRDKVE